MLLDHCLQNLWTSVVNEFTLNGQVIDLFKILQLFKKWKKSAVFALFYAG
jgi:hypothetical protein